MMTKETRRLESGDIVVSTDAAADTIILTDRRVINLEEDSLFNSSAGGAGGSLVSFPAASNAATSSTEQVNFRRLKNVAEGDVERNHDETICRRGSGSSANDDAEPELASLFSDLTDPFLMEEALAHFQSERFLAFLKETLPGADLGGDGESDDESDWRDNKLIQRILSLCRDTSETAEMRQAKLRLIASSQHIRSIFNEARGADPEANANASANASLNQKLKQACSRYWPEIVFGFNFASGFLLFIPQFATSGEAQRILYKGTTLQTSLNSVPFLFTTCFSVGCCIPLLLDVISSLRFWRTELTVKGSSNGSSNGSVDSGFKSVDVFTMDVANNARAFYCLADLIPSLILLAVIQPRPESGSGSASTASTLSFAPEGLLLSLLNWQYDAVVSYIFYHCHKYLPEAMGGFLAWFGLAVLLMKTSFLARVPVNAGMISPAQVANALTVAAVLIMSSFAIYLVYIAKFYLFCHRDKDVVATNALVTIASHFHMALVPLVTWDLLLKLAYHGGSSQGNMDYDTLTLCFFSVGKIIFVVVLRYLPINLASGSAARSKRTIEEALPLIIVELANAGMHWQQREEEASRRADISYDPPPESFAFTKQSQSQSDSRFSESRSSFSSSSLSPSSSSSFDGSSRSRRSRSSRSSSYVSCSRCSRCSEGDRGTAEPLDNRDDGSNTVEASSSAGLTDDDPLLYSRNRSLSQRDLDRSVHSRSSVYSVDPADLLVLRKFATDVEQLYS